MKKAFHSLAVCCVLALASRVVLAQQSLQDRLHQSEEVTSLDAPAMSPWYLKVSFQFLDRGGKPGEAGTFEESWAGPHKFRREFSTASYKAVDGETSEGAFRTKAADTPSYLLEAVARQFVHPLPNEARIAKSTPELRTQNFGKVSLECIMLTLPMKDIKSPPLGLFPAYCFDRGQNDLRVSMSAVNESIVRNGLAKLGGHLIPVDLQVNLDGLPAVRAHLESLNALSAEALDISMPSDAEKVSRAPTSVAGNVIAGSKLSGAQPVYPQNAKMNHKTGTVVLGAIIDNRGHIRSLNVVSAPDLDLAISALAAVRTWTYKPYSLNGAPTEVDTTITVNYAMKP